MDTLNGEGRDISDGGVTSPKAKRARPSPRVKNPTPGVAQNDQAHLMPVPEFAHQTTSPGVTHMVPQAYATHIQQPPTAPMNYAPPHEVASATSLPPMPRKLLPPKHDTASSFTGYLSYIIAKSATSFVPPVINTSFTLPWTFGIPRESITVPTTPGGKSIPIHDLLFRLTLRNEETDVPNGQDEGDKQENKEMEALVSMARKSMDVQNCLTEVAMSLVKVVQGVDGFVYAMSTASRVPGDHVDGASQGLLGGNWDITFVCTCSEEAKALPEQAKAVSGGENEEAQAGKSFACQGRIVIGFLEQEETVILKYQHCALHRPSGEIIHHHTLAERTIVGGVVSRKAPNPPLQSQQHPNGTAAYPPSNFYPQQQSHGYVLVNGQWYYPQHTPATPGHYSQPQQTSPPRADPQYQGITHSDPWPDDSMAQIYSAAMAQYSAPSRRKGRSGSMNDASVHAHSHGDASTEQRLLEQLSRELAGHPQQHGVEAKTEPEQAHHEGQGQEQQQQGYDYPAGYTYPSTTAYAHSAVTPLAGSAELGTGNGEVEAGGADGEGDMNMGSQEEQRQGGHEQVPVSSVDPNAGVKELVQQLVQQAQAGAGAGQNNSTAVTAPTAPPPPPPGSENPETRRRRGRASKS